MGTADARRKLLLLTAALLAALLITSCGGSSGREAEATPSGGQSTAQATAQLPSGWKQFQEGAYSGAVDARWSIFFLDARNLGSSVLDLLPENLRELVRRTIESGQLRDLFFVQIDDSANALILGPCRSGSELPRTAADWISGYRSAGVDARQAGVLRHRGGQTDLMLVRLIDGVDLYQATVAVNDCHLLVQFAERTGTAGRLDDFRRFMSSLDVDPRRLGR